MAKSSSEIVDVSFAGAVLTVGGRVIDDFLDDANPVEFQDMDIANVGFSVSGNMYRTIKPAPVLMSVTVISGSPSDKYLHGELAGLRLNEGNMAKKAEAGRASLKTFGTNGNNWSFSKGTLISGSPGPTVEGSGKMRGSTYTFAFSVME